MSVTHRPTREQLLEYAARRGLRIPAGELDAQLDDVIALLEVFDHIDDLEQPSAPPRYGSRDPGTPGLDPYGAVVVACHITGATSGDLAGLRVAIKDNIAVAGVPMPGAGARATAYTPDEDAVVVERLLDAGATIVAKTTMSTPGSIDVRNPLDVRYSAGVSSGGSAAAVAARIADVALGADQGGSIRWPAAWCGLVGLKPTHGLVPTYGLVATEHTIDHIGPLAKTVTENAAILDVIAGPDWRDPQGSRHHQPYISAADQDVRGMRLGIIAEALLPSGCEPDTLRTFEDACQTLRSLGAQLQPVSIPLWCDAAAIWLSVATFNETAMADSAGQGYGHFKRIDIDRLTATARRADPQPRTFLLTSEHLRRTQLGAHFGRAQNLRVELRRQVDALLEDIDVLISPTSPTGPTPLPTSPLDFIGLATNRGADNGHAFLQGAPMLTCCPFNLTGHPSLTIPCGSGSDGMPRGLQLTGRWYGEHTIYRVGHAYESTRGTG